MTVRGPTRRRLTACPVGIRSQLARRIHACTEAFPDGQENERFRDLVDIVSQAGFDGDFLRATQPGSP